MQATNTPLAAATAVKSIRPKEVAELLGISVPTVWRWVKRPDFPPPIRMSSRVTCWTVGEILAWRDAQTQINHKTTRSVGVRK